MISLKFQGTDNDDNNDEIAKNEAAGECSLLSLQSRQLPGARIMSGLSLRLYSRSGCGH